jgi:hypothetical protein
MNNTSNVKSQLNPCIVFLGITVLAQSALAASGMFPKMPAATNVYSAHCRGDGVDAKMTACALAGLVNQSSAEAYVDLKALDFEQLTLGGRHYTDLPLPRGSDRGLRALFKKYQVHVKKMILYDPAKDWTWYLALMAGAQQNGIPVTESNKNGLVSEFGWKGEVEDYRDRWENRIQAYDWALENLMPQCNKQVVFTVKYGYPLIDYVVASKGFVFQLDFHTNSVEVPEIEKIFRSGGYTAGASLMGYAGDNANTVANKFGIGYVVSDWYSNGSFWSSFPDKTYQQAPGHAIKAEPGKVYVAIHWSDGDNIQFDQIATYILWKDPARGTVPVGTTLSPTLQEVNSPLMDWYYANMSTNDELLAGPSGLQFIYGRNFNDDLFPAWCKLNREWLNDAGFHTACVWHTSYQSSKYSTYIATCGLTGILNAGNSTIVRYDKGMPVMDEGCTAWTEDEVFGKLSKVAPNNQTPVFVGLKCIVEGFVKGNDGYAKIKRQVDRLNATYPGRFVFLLPKDELATIRSYYHLPPNP